MRYLAAILFLFAGYSEYALCQQFELEISGLERVDYNSGANDNMKPSTWNGRHVVTVGVNESGRKYERDGTTLRYVHWQLKGGNPHPVIQITVDFRYDTWIVWTGAGHSYPANPSGNGAPFGVTVDQRYKGRKHALDFIHTENGEPHFRLTRL